MILAPHDLGLRVHSSRVLRGFTLVELVIVMAIVALLAVITGSRYLSYIEKVRVASAVASIRSIEVQLDEYVRSDEPLPATLAEIGLGDRLDPWGHPFAYLPFQASEPASDTSGVSDNGESSSGHLGGSDNGEPGTGGAASAVVADRADHGAGDSASDPIGGSYLGTARKDHFLVPLNSDYDLYSVGKDGETRAPLSAPVSADDVIRANDGAYIGLASNY